MKSLGKSTVTLRISSADVKEVALDLVKAAGEKGMTVAAVTCGERRYLLPTMPTGCASR